MTPVTPATSPILTWPAERFYWATLPPGSIRRDGVLPPGAIELVRDQVPVPMEQLHAVAVLATSRTEEASGAGGVDHAIVCMIEREALRSLDPGALMLTPEMIPPCVLQALAGTGDDRVRSTPSPSASLDAGPEASAPMVRVHENTASNECSPIDPSRLNLLTGEFEPRAFRSHRHRRAAIVLGAIAISCVAISLDLSRRAEQLWRIARDDTVAARALLAQASGSGVPDAIALERELEQLRAIASPAGRAASFDAPRALAEIVGAWPSFSGPSKTGPGESGAGNTGPGVEGALPQSLSVRPDASTLTVRTPGAPAAFLAAWKTPAGWASAEPRVQSGVQSNAQGGAEGGLVTLELKQVTPSDTKGGGR
ncbi:MAG: hypothetical protein JNL50_14925 [Phycisphaerae bacterium]|nr:hypothetical protein [Phycisphaerae bacterium]